MHAIITIGLQQQELMCWWGRVAMAQPMIIALLAASSICAAGCIEHARALLDEGWHAIVMLCCCAVFCAYGMAPLHARRVDMVLVLASAEGQLRCAHGTRVRTHGRVCMNALVCSV